MAISTEDELAFAGPGIPAKLVPNREVRPRELIELSLRRIEALNRIEVEAKVTGRIEPGHVLTAFRFPEFVSTC